MYNVKCECGREYRNVRMLPVHCRCGSKADQPDAVRTPRQSSRRTITGKPKPIPADVPCLHRGDSIGTADCDCESKPSVFSCGLLKKDCMPNKPLVSAMLVIQKDGSRKTSNPINCSECSSSLRVGRTRPVADPETAAVITTHYHRIGFSMLRES